MKFREKGLFFRENANFEKHGCQYLVAMVNVDAHFMTTLQVREFHFLYTFIAPLKNTTNYFLI